MQSLTIKDRAKRISHKRVKDEGKGGEEITELFGDVALALQSDMCSLKLYRVP